jgi:2-polyprenyl-3-methyl-5-hydroxy-6-metoxy-1,4-benzoquinol methylase
MPNKNLVNYALNYRELPFEPIQLSYRRKCVLNEIMKAHPTSLLEVGCGELPLFLGTDHFAPDIRHTIVEPSTDFFEHAKLLSINRPNVQLFCEFIEELSHGGEMFDMIIASCVLHEVNDPLGFLSSLRRFCGPDTIVHINVPNSNSFHRLLAVAMGLISHQTTKSDTQTIMQQSSAVYNMTSLCNMIESAGFSVINSGGIFVKPFTHAQMQHLVDIGFLTTVMLDGLDSLIQQLPDLGSEIWVNLRMN